MNSSTRICIACVSLFVLAACSAPDTKNVSPLGGKDISRQDTRDVSRLDPATGISSSNAIYETKVANGSSGATTSSVGSGVLSAETMSTAEFEHLLALPPLSNDGIQVQQIIPPDERSLIGNTTTYPERAQVLIALPTGRCSGVLVGHNLVLTAGHCVHSGGSSGSWYTSATVYPGKSGPQSPFGSCRARKFYSVVGWTRDKNQNYDIGAIKLDCSVGNQTGWLGFFWQSVSLVGIQARVSSYPGDKPLQQWSHSEPVNNSLPLKTYYRTDTVPGNSGSGVFANSGVPAGCGGPCVHTVHAYGGAAANSGTRITKPLFDNLVQWKAE